MEKERIFHTGDWIVIIMMLLCIGISLQIVLSLPKPAAIERSVESDNGRWSPHEWYHFVECQSIADNYGVLLKMWSWPDKTIHVHIPKDHLFETGTDSACQYFGEMCVKFLDIYDDGWLLTVTTDGNFIPSSKMPIDLEWAKILKEGY